MFIGVFKNLDNKIENNIYYSWELWHKDTFNPLIEIKGVLELKVKGKNYTQKKADLIDTAKEWQAQFAYYVWSYGEFAEITCFFQKNAKRYGLIKEFKENGII